MVLYAVVAVDSVMRISQKNGEAEFYDGPIVIQKPATPIAADKYVPAVYTNREDAEKLMMTLPADTNYMIVPFTGSWTG